MQLSVIEYARNVLGIKMLTSENSKVEGHISFTIWEGQRSDGAKGGSMRLGSYACALEDGTLAKKIYHADIIHERHRHRLEVNKCIWINLLIPA